MDVEDGWYHVTARGIERRAIFVEDREYDHFQELLEQTVSRYRVILHAFVQIPNHYHLIVETPDANLSRAMQWLNVSYAAWYNRRNDRIGPLFQGRFKSIPVENSAWGYELSLYVHLNPVMRAAQELSKAEKRAEGQGSIAPDEATVTRRLRELRQYRWSSYRAYAGYAKVPEWLETREILRRAAHKGADRVPRYRTEVQQRLTKGVEPALREQLDERFALGSASFRARVKELAKGGREPTGTRELRRRVSFEAVLDVVAELREAPSAAFMEARGDWGRPLVLWAVRQFCGMTLSEIGQEAGGMDYTAVAMAIRRFEHKARQDRNLSRLMAAVRRECEM